MNDPKTMSDILQEIKKSLNFVYGIRCDYIDDELLKMERCKGKLPLIVMIDMAICKKLSGNRGVYYDIFKEWCHEEAEEEGGQG